MCSKYAQNTDKLGKNSAVTLAFCFPSIMLRYLRVLRAIEYLNTISLVGASASRFFTNPAGLINFSRIKNGEMCKNKSFWPIALLRCDWRTNKRPKKLTFSISLDTEYALWDGSITVETAVYSAPFKFDGSWGARRQLLKHWDMRAPSPDSDSSQDCPPRGTSSLLMHAGDDNLTNFKKTIFDASRPLISSTLNK